MTAPARPLTDAELRSMANDEAHPRGTGIAFAHDGRTVLAYSREIAAEMLSLRARLAEVERERDEARATLRAFIGSVEEMTLGEGVPAGLVVTDDGGKTVRVVESRVTRPWYTAIMCKWHRDAESLVRMYEGHRRDKYAAEARLARLRPLVRAAVDWRTAWPEADSTLSGRVDWMDAADRAWATEEER